MLVEGARPDLSSAQLERLEGGWGRSSSRQNQENPRSDFFKDPEKESYIRHILSNFTSHRANGQVPRGRGREPRAIRWKPLEEHRRASAREPGQSCCGGVGC